MATAQKIFETLFRINAQWKGQAAVKAAQVGMTRTAAAAEKVNVRVRGMATAVFKGQTAYNLMSRAISGVITNLSRAAVAARDAQDVHDDLALSIERNAASYKELAGKSPKEVERILNANIGALVALSEQMEKTGHDAETLQAGWTQLTGSLTMSPKQMQQHGKQFSDLLSRLYGANATQEESLSLGQDYSAMVREGNIGLGKQLKLGDSLRLKFLEIRKELKKGEITQEEAYKRRQAAFDKAVEAAGILGETERVFAKPSGKLAHLATTIDNLFEKAGKSFAERAPEMAASIDKISESLGPVLEKLSVIVDQQLKELGNWLATHKLELPTWLEEIWGFLKKIADVLNTINSLADKMPVLFDVKKWWAEGQKALPESAKASVGTDTSMPGLGFGTSETEQRAVQKRQWAPYQRELQATTASAGPIQNSTIAAMRASRVAEIQNDPALKKFFAAAISKEAGTPAGVQAVTEALFNRAQQRGKGIQHELTHGFYGPVNRGEVQAMVNQGVPDWAMKQADQALAKVAAGSNLIEGRTDQGMINEIKGPKKQFGGEWFGYMPGTQEWSERFNKRANLKDLTSALGPRAGGGTSTNNISMSSPVTVNGVAPGREYQVGRSVRNAMQRPMREFLDQIKGARAHESRLGYV